MPVYGATPAEVPAARMALPVTPLALNQGPGTVEVSVEDAPAFAGFEITLTYDPAVVALAGVAPGALLTSSGGKILPQGISAASPGTVRYALMLDDLEVWPSGTGPIARFAFSPLAQAEGSPLTLAEAMLIDQTGQRISAATRNGSLTVGEAPAAAAVAAAATEAATLALATPAADGSLGRVTAPSLDLAALLSGGGAAVVWLATLVAGLTIAVAGWALGRRG
jgi:hypothetical protein